MTSTQQAEQLRYKCSLALHLGTYAAAVENILRRMAYQDSPEHTYWLHQLQLDLKPGDLAAGVEKELSGMFGDVSMTELSDRTVRAVRYVNVQEAVGSISLAIDPRVIGRVRTIELPVGLSTVPGDSFVEGAVVTAVTDLAAAEALRPDTSGVPAEQIFESELDAILAGVRREVDPGALKLAQQMDRYRDRRAEVWSALQTVLVDTYLAEVNIQVRERFTTVVPTGGDPSDYHERFRQMAGLLVRPQVVVEQLGEESWRPMDA